MSSIFPSEIIAQFARTRDLLLVIRCTCSEYTTLVSGVGWSFQILRREFSRSRKFVVSFSTLVVSIAEGASCELTINGKFICLLADDDLWYVTLAREFILAGKNPNIKWYSFTAASEQRKLHLVPSPENRQLLYSINKLDQKSGGTRVYVYASAEEIIEEHKKMNQ
jgi:hypothetical protein